MKYKVIDYVSGYARRANRNSRIVFGTAMVENGSITVGMGTK